MRLSLVVFAPLLPLLAVAQTKPDSPFSLERMVVTTKRPSAADGEGAGGIRTYDSTEMENSGAFSAEEFLDTLPRGNGDQQVVLIDGVPADIDISTLSPAMIERIEVSYSGSMPAYGAYARGRVVNIKLKENADVRELSLESAASLHGDGWRRDAMVNVNLVREAWRVFASARYSRGDAVTADERDYSRAQDHRATGGKDFRTPWGDPAVVQAVTGNLNGVRSASGSPVPVALVPEGAAGPLAPGDFLAGVGPNASGQRFFDTSPYLYLRAPAENTSGNLRVTRTFDKKLTISLGVSYSAAWSRRQAPPPVSAATAETLVPASLNPFGQDVMVGLVHTGFGPVVQQSDNEIVRFILATSWMGKTWRTSAFLSHSRSLRSSDTRDLDPAALTAALASPDPTKRFNPFTGLPGSPANAALYPSLAIHRMEDASNSGTQFYLRANGPVAPGRSAGPMRLSFGASGNWREDERTFRHLRGVADASTLNHDGSGSIDASAVIPLFKERPHFYLLESELSGAYSFNDNGGATARRSAELSWSPAKPWRLDVNFGGSRSSPGERADDDIQSFLDTLIDPRRTPATAENVQVISRRTAATRSSHAREFGLGISFEPASRPGLQFTLNYNEGSERQGTGSPFSPQDVIDNEGLFAGRVVRDAPTAADLALGQPGRILSVDTTPTAVAGNERSSLNFDVNYQLPERPAGRFQLSAGAGRVLTSRYELEAGQQFVSREDGPANQPDWTGRARVQWQRKQWNAAAQVRYTSASRQGTIPAYANVSLNVGYRFVKSIWGKIGKDLQLRASVQNLGGDRPPYADTLLGYRGGSAVGTTFSLSARLPL